jgi:hypothetical protein
MILIGVPCTDTIKSRTAFSLYFLGQFHAHEAVLEMERGADLAQNRNKLVASALNRRATHILLVDSDMEFNHHTLSKMLAHDKDILGLAANRRKLPLESVVKPLNPSDVNGELPNGLFEAESCGTGVMLIKTDVFKKLPAPWFDFGYDDKGERVGEDVRFCRLAREHGYKIFVDPTIPVRHIGEYAY